MTKQKKIAWITDSTATLSKEYIGQHHIYVVPLEIIFGNESFKEDVDITAEAFYKRLAESKELPKTSQPAIGEFVSLYEKLKEEYEYAIAIHASSALTGTYQTSVSAAAMVGLPIEIIDSKIGSYALGKMVQKGIELEQQGRTYEEIVSYLQTLPNKGRLYMIPGSLEQLHKGGRVSTTQALIGNLIKLRLLIKFDNGKAVLFDKIRTDSKAKARLYEILAADASHIREASIIHGNDPEKAIVWKQELEQIHPHITFTTTMFSPVPGTHTGQGTMGLTWISE